MNKQPTFFYTPTGEDIARRFLEICQGDYLAARRAALRGIDATAACTGYASKKGGNNG